MAEHGLVLDALWLYAYGDSGRQRVVFIKSKVSLHSAGSWQCLHVTFTF